jgi:hypothetical protein
MVGDDQPKRDLLGDPWTPPRDPRGRRPLGRKSQVAENIAVLRAAGNTVEEIALVTGISEPTLRKYYFRELDKGLELARAVLIKELWRRALDGSVPAIREVFRRFETGAAAVPVPRRPKADDKLGKKAAADLDAQTAHEDTEWGQLLN